MDVKIKADLLNQVLAYLATRPYQEVAGLIQAVQQGAEIIGEIIHEDTSGEIVHEDTSMAEERREV